MGKKEKLMFISSLLGLILVLIFWRVSDGMEREKQKQQMEELREMKMESSSESQVMAYKNLSSDGNVVSGDQKSAGIYVQGSEDNLNIESVSSNEWQALYEINTDLIGWLSIDGTNIDYPVMQKKEDEDYYLTRDFYGKEDKNGCLILDSDSTVGKGVTGVKDNYEEPPSSNLIIHGHHMKNGDMFGELELFSSRKYTEKHPYICFDTGYEKRTYEVFAVFYSQVYEEKDNVFKYYEFFQARTEEELYSFTLNCKNLSLFDTGVEVKSEDEFITLSTCAYQAENGRFVVVGKRII